MYERETDREGHTHIQTKGVTLILEYKFSKSILSFYYVVPGTALKS